MTENATMPVEIRKATAGDQAAIVTLVRAERLNPHGLDWANFFVAVEGDALIGAVQIRRHRDGSRELGSLVVAPTKRGNGLAARLIDHVLAAAPGPMHVITGRAHAHHYARWGFEPIGVWSAPAGIRWHCLLGQVIGGVHAVLTGRR
jgi:N-acetylglutamate synthase-like GNAT family acetyltransferase